MTLLSSINGPLVRLDFIALEEYVEFKTGQGNPVDLQKNNSPLSIGAIRLVMGFPD